MSDWRAVGFVTKTEFVDGIIKTECPFKDLSEEENKIIDEIIDCLEESYYDEQNMINLLGTGDFASASAEIDCIIENYKDEGEEVPDKLLKGFELLDSLSDYSYLETIKEVEK